MGVNEIGLQAKGFAEFGNGCVKLVNLQQKEPEIETSLGVMGLQSDSLAHFLYGFVCEPYATVANRKFLMYLSFIWLNPDGPLEFGNCVIEFVLRP